MPPQTSSEMSLALYPSALLTELYLHEEVR